MPTITERHETAMGHWTEAQQLLESARAEKREEESQRFDTLIDAAEAERAAVEQMRAVEQKQTRLDDQMRSLTEISDFLDRRNVPPPVQVRDAPGSSEDQDPWLKLRQWMLTGHVGPSGRYEPRMSLENALGLTSQEELGQLGEYAPAIRGLVEPHLRVPADRMPVGMRRQVINTGTAGQGGNLVQEVLASWIEQELKSYSGARQTNATVIRTARGNDFIVPTNDAWSNTNKVDAKIIAQPSGAAAEGRYDFGIVTFKSYTYASPKIPVRHESLTDSEFDIARWVIRTLVESIARDQAEDFTTGAGTAGPAGYAKVGATTTDVTFGATATTITYENLVDITAELDPAHVGMGGSGQMAQWTMNRKTMAKLQKLTGIGGYAYDSGNSSLESVGDGRPLWSFGDIRTGIPTSLLGYPVILDVHLSDMGATGNEFIGFGNFSKFVIRDVASMELLRDPYTAGTSYQTVFTAFMRASMGPPPFSGGNRVEGGGPGVGGEGFNGAPAFQRGKQ